MNELYRSIYLSSIKIKILCLIASVESNASRATTLTQALASHTQKASADPKLDLDILNYGEADKPAEEKGEIVVRPDITTERKGASAKSGASSSSGAKSEQAVSPVSVKH